MKEEALITYCGGFGGTCARWCEYTRFREMATLLAEWVDAQGYQHWMPQETKDFDYNEFRKGLSFFGDRSTWLVCHRCCKGGDGNPECRIRICCKEKGVEMCFDCNGFPCEKVKNDTEMMDRSIQYRQLGRKQWLSVQVEKAQKGYEGHTKRYYGITAEADEE